jgi:hypothetical protein
MTRLFQTDSLSPLYIEATGDDSNLPETIS